MLDYTKAALNKTVGDLKRVAFWFTVFMQVMMIGFPAYSIGVNKGNLYINIVLILTSLTVLVFYILRRDDDKPSKTRSIRAKNIGKIIRYSSKVYNLCLSVYGIYIAAEHTTLVSVVFAGLMAITLFISLSLDVVVAFCKKRFELFITAFEADFEFVTKPMNKVQGVIDFVRGKESAEPEEPQAPSKIKARQYLDGQVEEQRNRKNIEKKEARAEYAAVRRKRIKKLFDKIKGNKTDNTEPERENEKAAK